MFIGQIATVHGIFPDEGTASPRRILCHLDEMRSSHLLLTFVKVVRDMITNNLTGTGAMGMAGTGMQQPPVCPPRRSTGFFPGGDGTIPNARPGLLPGTWIGPTLVFAGVLNPGIPTTIPPTNPVANNNGTQVQIAPAAAQSMMNGTTISGTTTGAGGTTIG